MTRLNDGWEFVFSWTAGFARGEGSGTPVRLPHTAAEVPLHCADHQSYQTVCGYRRRLVLPGELWDRRFFLQLDGAAHIATVYVNGKPLDTHRCGYTAFRVELTDALTFDPEGDLLAIRVDATENPSIPPFGFTIDYLTYGGLYRDVWLDVRPQNILDGLFVHTPALDEAHVSCQADLDPGDKVRFELFAPNGRRIARRTSGRLETVFRGVKAPRWDLDHPELCRCRATIIQKDGTEGDRVETLFGFRTAVFQRDGFYLNGEKIFLRGLNRHQSFPWLGYAAPESLQREDARILKEELRCNAVRTSHYPQSPWFLDACDRLGLLVFTELPGWQHIGDGLWKDQACKNVEEMVTQCRNHPSVILWGVRINESRDDDPFYTRTNAIAHSLDPSRATSGVRYLKGSSLLEDVYAFNDFSHRGDNPGALPREEVCPGSDAALLISECNGHMFPTKPFDPWERRQEQALRHARVLDAAMSDGGHAGFFAWCMFDYPTHKDFGSGDRVCYHGVLDAFRNPKLAAALYASQGEGEPVLEVGSSMDIGDYSASEPGRVWAFTNAKEVRLYRDGAYYARLTPGEWSGLPHGPHYIDLAPGDWGAQAPVWRFDAVTEGKTVASVTRVPFGRPRLEVRASAARLTEGEIYDMAAVRIRVLDQFGNPLPYAQLPARLTLEGPGQLAGPDLITLEGGCGGTYVRTTGEAGTIRLTVHTPQTDDAAVELEVVKA